MRRLTPIAALLLTVAASACAPNPIIARDPVPAPGPADAYTCRSRPMPLNAFITNCEPVPTAPQVVLRSRG
jgi:hypothetical protein